MSTDLVLLALLMFGATYPTRALGLLWPGIDRLPRVALDYLQLVGPAVLTALAAVNVMVVVEETGADVPRRHRVGGRAGLPGDHGLAQEPAAGAHAGGGHRGGRARDRSGGDPG